MKRLFNLFVILVFITCSISISANAANDISVKLNGRKLSFDQPPIIKNERTLVPMRAIFEAMGCVVEWDDGMIDVFKNEENIMTLWVDDTEMWTADKGYFDTDVAPIVVNERTLVPVRVISESIGATVDWDGGSLTVIIIYNEDSERENISSAQCSHANTRELCMIDLRKYENTGSSTTHTRIDVFETYCDYCDELVKKENRDKTESHSFDGYVCEECGYEKESVTITLPDPTATPTKAPAVVINPSSDEITDYIDGAFMYITVPSGKSIKVPNTSNGMLKVQLEGVYNVFERESDGDINSNQYNTKNKKSSVSISKGAEAIIQNSGTVDLTVSIPTEYAQYQETNEKVYETVYLNSGDSVKLTANNNQGDYVYFSNKQYEYIQYVESKNQLSSANVNGLNSDSIAKNATMIITATGSLEVYYCPATVNCNTTGETAFQDVSVGSGETVRIYASSDSKVEIYSDDNHQCDYVQYRQNGTTKSQKQDKTFSNITISKDCYLDLTNKSSSTMIIQVSNIYGTVEYR